MKWKKLESVKCVINLCKAQLIHIYDREAKTLELETYKKCNRVTILRQAGVLKSLPLDSKKFKGD